MGDAMSGAGDAGQAGADDGDPTELCLVRGIVAVRRRRRGEGGGDEVLDEDVAETDEERGDVEDDGEEGMETGVDAGTGGPGVGTDAGGGGMLGGGRLCHRCQSKRAVEASRCCKKQKSN